MNAAFLLLATCMSDAHPVLINTPECSSCAVGSESGKPGGICHMSGPWSCWCFGKKKDCGHHIHCPHPGPIPGTQHLTFKQACKDRFCPNRNMIPYSQHCEKECATTILVIPSNVIPSNVIPIPSNAIPGNAEQLKMPKADDNQSRFEPIKVKPSPVKPVTPVHYTNESPY